MSTLCGCHYQVPSSNSSQNDSNQFLPQVQVEAHATILSTTSRTTLRQTFLNPSSTDEVKECVYTFPLYEGVSVVSFTCRVGSRTLRGVVKEKSKANETFETTTESGGIAGLLEQLAECSDIFSTRLGNIPAGRRVHVEITYVGELKHDAQRDGIRFTLPMDIAPRYGRLPLGISRLANLRVVQQKGIKITVDVSMAEGSEIRAIESPTHPVAVTLGPNPTQTNEGLLKHQASATLSSPSAELDKDFVLIIRATELSAPKAILETHSSIPHQRALMVTLVPKFSIPLARPEIIFLVDRSGSMYDKIPTLIAALKAFLKSIPPGARFNICCFGSVQSFLWPRSVPYDQSSLDEATRHVETFMASFGCTETYTALQAVIDKRVAHLPCEVLLLTDGQIYNQADIFYLLNNEVANSKSSFRVFVLGIGDSASHALIEGIARAGNGFAQTVVRGENLDKKVVQMLKQAVSTHLEDYSMEVKYESTGLGEHEFELVEKVTNTLQLLKTDEATEPAQEDDEASVSFYDPSLDYDSDDTDKAISGPVENGDPYAHLPAIAKPKLIQTPSVLPSMFSFSRFVIYILLSEETVQDVPKSVILRAKTANGRPLQIDIPVETIQEPGKTIHQLAARKVIQEFEEGRGWIFDSKDETGVYLRNQFPGAFEDMVEREAVRLGTLFQVSGKWLSFVAAAEEDYEATPQEAAEDGSTTVGGGNSSPSTITDASDSSSVTMMMGVMSKVPDSDSSDDEDVPTRIMEMRRRVARSRAAAIDSRAQINRPSPFMIDRCSKAASNVASSATAPAPSRAEQLHANETVHALIELQNCDGYWDFSERLASIIGIQQDFTTQRVSKTVVITAKVIKFLEVDMRAEQDLWELVVDKAWRWLGTQNISVGPAQQEVESYFS